MGAFEKVRTGFPKEALINAWRHKLGKGGGGDHSRHKKSICKVPVVWGSLARVKGWKQVKVDRAEVVIMQVG